MRPFCIGVLLTALLVLLSAKTVYAHGMRSGYVEVIGHGSDTFSVKLRTSKPGMVFGVNASEGCSFREGQSTLSVESGATLAHGELRCVRESGSKILEVVGQGDSVAETAVFVTEGDGSSRALLLTGSSTRIDLSPPERTRSPLGASTMFAGARHVLTGWDHILFLFVLCLGARTLREVLVAETAFTVAHCAAYALAATEVLRLPSAPTEVLIATTILLSASSLPLFDREVSSSARRATTAGVFGIVHGLGFAGGLRELGASADSAATSLAGFAIGVELVQLGLVLGIFGILRRTRKSSAGRLFVAMSALGAGGWATFLLAENLVMFAKSMKT